MGKASKIVALFAKNIYIVLGLVLIWRGVWYVLDGMDIYIFGSSHLFTGLGGIILGAVLLYLPDHDLKEISKL